jgi:hypothetical protein
MAVLPQTNLTLLDLAKAQDPDGNLAKVIEMQTRTEEFLLDMNFIQGNLDTGHRTTIRTGLPTTTLRLFNEYVAPSNGTEAQVTFETTQAETWLQADAELVKLAPSPEQFLASKSLANLESLSRKVADTSIYGNHKTNPRECTGIMSYYNDSTAESGDNLIKAGGSGSDNASIIFVGWGDETITGIVPKRAATGLQITDLGEQVSENASGLMLVRRMKMLQHFGLANMDWRYSGRIANIDRSVLAANPLTAYDLPDLMFSLLERVKDSGMTRGTFYMDKTIREVLRKQLANRTSDSSLKWEDVGGIRTAMFQGKPVRVTEAMRVNEATVA